jgi:AraC family transcriptional regulator, regulatory protein of adaptative response / methylated-DNA-[protein]-cysteine methyltransferase
LEPRAKFPPVTPEHRWRIVLARDRRYDGAFVYAVRSTGIYCRPSCASRRPRRGQVTFFPIPEAAEREGYRACRRCHPADANGGDPAVALVREACRALDTPSAERPKLDRGLLRAFKRVLGITPQQYRDARRVARFKHELKRRPHVSPAVYEAGYGSSSRVYERANAQLGMTPATYARGGAGTEIAFAVVASSLGKLLVAATARGVCRVSLGDDTPALEADLAAEFPAAHIRKDRATLDAIVTAILDYLDGSEPHLALPLDIRATAFQRRVWQELQRIPYGETRSYADVAKRIGHPTASRAVARACAMNPAALVIPCHRVVRENGDLGGYRWGVDRKRALLERERDA